MSIKISTPLFLILALAIRVAAAPAPSTPAMTIGEFSELFGGPTLVSLHLKNVTLREAITELSKQSPVPIEASNEGNDELFWQQQKARVTVDIENAPFWTAARALTPSDCSLVWSLNRAGRAFAVRPEPVPTDTPRVLHPPAQAKGLFFITADSWHRHHTHDVWWSFGGKPFFQDEASEKISFSLLADPKLLSATGGSPLLSGSYIFAEATDDTGKNLWHDEQNYRAFQNDGFPLFGLEASFPPLSPKTRFLKSVRGHVRFAVVTKSEQWKIAIENGTAQAGRDFKISSDDTQGSAKNFHLAAKVEPFGKGSTNFNVLIEASNTRPPYSLAEIAIGAVRLEDAEGKAIYGDLASSGLTRWQGNYALSVRHTGAPSRLLITIPTQIRRLEIPFEFHNLPAPPVE